MKLPRFIRIRFTDRESLETGYALALLRDTIVYTPKSNEFLLPESTVAALEEKHISFERR